MRLEFLTLAFSLTGLEAFGVTVEDLHLHHPPPLDIFPPEAPAELNADDTAANPPAINAGSTKAPKGILEAVSVAESNSVNLLPQ